MEETKNSKESIFNSLPVKLGIIMIIVLILLIPQSFTANLIDERQGRQMDVENDVTNKWSSEQTLTGPYLSLPFYTEREVTINEETQMIKDHKTAYFFPDELNIDSQIEGIPLHRGIFDVVVYKSNINISGNYNRFNFKNFPIEEDKVDWENIKFHIGISDLRGIGENPTIKINGKTFEPQPFSDSNNKISGLVTSFPASSKNDLLKFDCQLNLKGSKGLYFTPLGQTTTVSVQGQWDNPSFQGNYLPESRVINDEGFKGEWKILHFNRSFAQETLARLPDTQSTHFGLSLKMPVDQYQQSTRSSKYALLVISLSFLALLLMELITKVRIHFLQYTLIGAGLVLYYTLLIALSEHLGFDTAYLIASLATIILLGAYSLTFVAKKKNSFLFVTILSVFYIFVLVITKEQDYALLIGSIGLFIALALTMFVSGKIEFNKLKEVRVY